MVDIPVLFRPDMACAVNYWLLKQPLINPFLRYLLTRLPTYLLTGTTCVVNTRKRSTEPKAFVVVVVLFCFLHPNT